MTLHSVKTLLLITAIVLGNLIVGHSQTTYVKEGATGSGTSWSNATGNLKAAIDAATIGSEIWVAVGIYYPTTCSSCVFEDRQVSFIIGDDIKLYGGFVGNESLITERDIENNPTRLSGNIDMNDTPWNNSYSVIRTQNVTNATVIDGFIIEDGTADFGSAAAGDSYNSGAGWYNTGALSSYFAHPIARNCIFRNHYAAGLGAAIYNDGAFDGTCNPVFENCVFENCTAELEGGAIYNNAVFGGDCSPTFTDCTFTNNHSLTASGGAISNEGAEGGICNPSFVNCNFLNNTSAISGGAMYNIGRNGVCNPVFTDSEFDGNSSGSGGAIYNDGSFMGEASPYFSNCNFTNNHCTSGSGGVIYNSGIGNGTTNLFFQNCVFHQNQSKSAAGVMFNNGSGGTSSPTFFNCVFSENLAEEVGAVMYNLGTAQGNSSPSINNCLFYRNTAIISAAGIYNLGAQNGNSSPIVTNCTFFGNSAPISGAIYNNANDASGTADAVITNCIFWANNAPLAKVLRNIWSHPTIDHCIVDVANCDELNSGNDAILNCGNHMIYNQSPMFVDTANNDFRLLVGSPAIDAGDNGAAAGIGADLDGLPRVEGMFVDMGAYEFGSVSGTPPIITMNPQSQNTCEGEDITFSVTATSTVALTYQWQKDGNNITGATTPNYIILSVMDSDAGSYHCQVSNALGESITTQDAALTVGGSQSVSVVITASATEICEGEGVVISALPVNEGASPLYQWMINGNNFGGSISSFTMEALQDGDEITLILTSSADCVGNPVTASNVLVFSVGSTFEPSLAISAPVDTSICMGAEVTFLTTTINGGSTPFFQWLLNGSPVGTNESTYLTNNLEDGDVVNCQMTSSISCAIPSLVISNLLEIMVDTCSVPTREIFSNADWSISPNPAKDEVLLTINTEFNYVAIHILNLQGQLMEEYHIENTQGKKFQKNIRTDNLNSGTYFIKIQNGNVFAVKKLILTQ